MTPTTVFFDNWFTPNGEPKLSRCPGCRRNHPPTNSQIHPYCSDACYYKQQRTVRTR